MQLNPSEISDLLKKRIEGLGVSADLRTQGTVVSVTDGICRVHGLSDVMQGEMLEFPGNTYGLALNLERDSVGAVILGSYEHISEGDLVKTTGKILSVPVGPELIGRVVNALGQPIDGKGPINTELFDVVEKVAPGVIDRQSVSQPVQTGLKSVDSMIPIGRGQRELIMATASVVRPPSPSTRSSTRRARTLPACTLPSARRPPRSPTSFASSKKAAPWNTPSSLPPRLPNPPPCSTSLRTPAPRWVNTSATAVKTP